MSKKNKKQPPSRGNTSTAQSASAVRRKKREKVRRMRMYIAIIILVVGIVFAVLVFNVFFNIRTVEVVGSTNYTSDEIFNASGITVGDNLLRENADKCSENITSALVYVESAQVKKVYPNTIKITVEAGVPFANVRTSNGCLLISQGGKILEKLINPRSGIMEINGAEADVTLEVGDRLKSIDEKKNEDIYNLIKAFKDSGYDSTGITYIDITDRSNIFFEYDGRIKVELGFASDLDYKLKFVSEIVTNQLSTGVTGTLRLLPDSAQFIDEAGLDENERIFQRNSEIYAEAQREAELTAVETDENGIPVTSDSTSETTAAANAEGEEQTSPPPQPEIDRGPALE